MIIPVWGYALAAGVTVAVSFGAGWKVADWRCDAAKAEEMAKAQRRFDKQLEQAQQAAADYEKSRARGQAESRERETTIREVFRNVEVPSDCAAPDAVRGVLRDAVRAANGAPASEPGSTVPPAS